MTLCSRHPEWHKEPEVRAALEKFYHKYARPPDSSEAKQDLVRRLDIISSHLQKQGHPFKGNVYVDSTSENLKMSNGLEFEVLIVLDGRSLIAVPTSDPQYNLIKPNPRLDPPKLNPWMIKDGVITAEKVGLKFEICLAKLAGMHPDFSRPAVVFHKHGPAIQMDVNTPRLTYSADLVPTYRIRDNYYEAVQHDAWLCSYSIKTTQTLDHLDRDNGCRRQTGRTLNALCQKEPGLETLTANHLQLALLHEVTETPERSWQPREFAFRFFVLLRRVASYIDEGNFPHYFLPEVNLVESSNTNTKDRLVKLYNEKNTFLKAVSVDDKRL